MGAVYHFLGLSVGVLQDAHRTDNGRKAFVYDPAKEAAQEDQHQLRLVDRKEAYAADITYGTNNEFGFDYLRDNMAYSLDARVQRRGDSESRPYYAIVDEVDNILIDEARTPLIISGPSQEDPSLYAQCARVVKQLKPEDFEIDERGRSLALTEVGEAHLERLLGQPLRDPDRPEEVTPDQARLLGHIEQALRAEFIFKKNKDYLVQAGKIIIVDEFTGRMMPGRRWSDGLHQAVEAKEGVPVQQDNVTYATITLQNYFRLYQKLAGMTGTALTEAEEFDRIYKLAVVAVPTHLEYQATRPDSSLVLVEYKEAGDKFQYFARQDDAPKTPVYWRRKDYADLVYRTEEAKLRAVVTEMFRRHLLGQPLLIGTTSVEMSEHISERLRPDPLQRLAQVLLIRDAWFEKNEKEEDGILVPELKPLDAPLSDLNRQELAKQSKELGLSSNPAGDENVARLLKVLNVPDERGPELVRVLQAGIKHNVLNAKKHDEESRIIADAGALGAVTIATNMAGRGVDIKLGGEMAEEVLTAVNRILRRSGVEDPYDLTHAERKAALLNLPESEWGIYEAECRLFLRMMEDAEKVREVGGLHVVGSERHEARRIDNQLRGRAARQGDPGSSQFFLSLEDDLMRRFGGQNVSDLMQRLKIDDGVPIAAGIVNRVIEQSQTRVEGANFDIRKHLLEYDDVLNSQRNAIYTQRDRVFTKDDLTDDFDEMLVAEVERRIQMALADDDGRWKLFAWLDEVQPAILVSEAEAYPSYLLEVLLREVDESDDKRAALLEIAKDALEAERQHLLDAVQTQIERTEERLDEQTKEKRRQAEEALEALENQAEETGRPVEARAAFRAVGEALGVNLQPTTEQVRAFNLDHLKRDLATFAEGSVSARARLGLVAAIERRLGASLGLGKGESPIRPNADEDWTAIQRQLLEATEKAFKTRTERALAEMKRELETNLPAAPTRAQLTLAFINMAWGRAVGFDRNHRRVEMRTQRLTYVFLAAQMTAAWDAGEFKEEILAHLRGAEQVLRRMFGEADLRANPPAEMPAPETHAALVEERGRKVLTDIYRQLMLQVIGGLWVDYLTQVEALRTSIGLEAYAQRDPLVAYKSRAFEMFKELLANMRAGVVSRALTLRPRVVAEAPARAAQVDGNGAAAKLEGAPKQNGAAAVAASEPASEGQGGGRRRRRRR
jgi:preprotein translocase subunit SecA